MKLCSARAGTLGVACSLLSLTLSLARTAQAAPCGRPDVDLTFPPDGATSVPTNGVFAAHYAAPALYDNQTVDFSDADGNPVPATVTYDDAESLLRLTPDQPLASGQLKIVWPGLRGVGMSGGLGRGRTTTFFVGSVADAAPPNFSGLIGIDWDLARDRDPCLDKLDDRFVFKLEVGAASDDLGSDLLQLVVFQTKDPTRPKQADPTEIALLALPAHGSVEVRRPASNAGSTCFAAVVQDLLGNVSGGGEREVCIKTRKPPFFEGCAVASSAPGAGPALDEGTVHGQSTAALALLGLWLFRRGRSARKPPAHI
jgi:hypothetical protein